MTVSAELQKTAQRLEYFVTIEGVGWPANGLHGDLSGGFDGDIFTTNDINGDLDTQLQATALTVHHGLQLPSSISESIDPKTASYSPSGLSFTIVDHDDFWIGAVTPRKSGAQTTLSQECKWADTEPRLTDGTSFSTGQAVWVGGRELVKLGTKTLVAGVNYRYPGSVRGYLGTQRGSSLRRPEDYCLGHWPTAATVYSVGWWWYNRQVAIWAHVPGEASSNCQLVWYGRLRPIKNPSAGVEFRFDAAGDFISTVARIRRAVDWVVSSTKLADGRSARSTDHNWLYRAGQDAKRLMEFAQPKQSQIGAENEGTYELAAAYTYRNMPGGLESLVTSWDAGNAQARDFTSPNTETDVLYSYVYAGDSVFLMYSRETFDSNTDPRLVRASIISHAGESRVSGAVVHNGAVFSPTAKVEHTLAVNTPARFLLDNIHQGKYKGRFNLWGNIHHGVKPTRHPIDVALMFMLSMDRELQRADTAAGSTTTVVNFTTDADNDDLIGKALFIMEGNGGVGTAPEMDACAITDNDSSSVTFRTKLSAAPNAAIEVQVRNSIYDVLPIGWGLGIDSNAVDITSFEQVRDEEIPDCKLGDFILGVQDEIDIWEMLYENIFKPYGILVYFDYSTRKITAKYLGTTPEDDVFETFTTISEAQIMDPGSITHVFANPVSAVKLNVRATEQRVVGAREATNLDYIEHGPVIGHGFAMAVTDRRAALMDGKKSTVVIRSKELNLAFGEHHLDTIEINAMLNTDVEEELIPLAARLLGMISEYSVPPPVWRTKLDVELYQDCKPGAYVSITWASAPSNPFTGNRGWSSVIGRVVRRSYPLDDKVAFDCTIELLTTNKLGRVAPAVVVTAKGSDGLGAYFECATADESQNFVADPDANKDWYDFVVGDELEHRDSAGKAKAGWTNRSVTGFGTDERADPTTAPGSPMRIYVDGAIGSAMAAGDYITLAAWPTSCPTRRSYYSTYADANEELGPDNDPAKVYE